MSTADFAPEYEPPFRGPVAQRTNGMAVASLVCGILFCVGVTAPLAIIFGIVGLLKTRDPQVGGKGMSIVGIILGIFGIAFWAVLGIAIYLFSGVTGSLAATQFTALVDDGKIDEALKMTTEPVTRADVEKLADDLKTWGKPGTFTADPGFSMTVDENSKQSTMVYAGTAKFEKVTKKYRFEVVNLSPPGAMPRPDPKAPMGNSNLKIRSFRFD